MTKVTDGGVLQQAKRRICKFDFRFFCSLFTSEGYIGYLTHMHDTRTYEVELGGCPYGTKLF